MSITVKELIQQLSKIEDQDAEVVVDAGAVFLDIDQAGLVEFTTKDGGKVYHAVLK